MTTPTAPTRGPSADAAVPTGILWLRACACAAVVGFLVLHALQPADTPAMQVDIAEPADTVSLYAGVESGPMPIQEP